MPKPQKKEKLSMKKILFALFLIAWIIPLLPAQDTQYTSAADSDPEAKAILNQLRRKYDAYSSLQAEFSLKIELAEQPAEVQNGTIKREGNKYHLEMNGQDVISDGKSLFLILHNNKEVQINDVPEEDETGSILSPQSIFKLYESDQFVYILVNEVAKSGTVVQQIEMKPLDDYADYSKVRMEVDKKRNAVMNVIAFGKDGSRFTFTLDSVTPNKSFPAGTFAFDKSKYPDYYVEDLRY
jgi:outer membrane lipoprotein carrier protein